MITWRNTPCLAIGAFLYFAFFFSGIFNPISTILWILLAITIICFCLLVLRKFADPVIPHFILGFALVCCTIIRYQSHISSIWPTSLNESISSKEIHANVEVRQILKTSEERITIKAKLLSTPDSIPIDDKFILVRIKKPIGLEFLPGDIMQVTGKLTLPDTAVNPHSFNAREYYASIGIRYILNTTSDALCIMTSHRAPLHRQPAKWQKSLSEITNRNTSSPTAQLANALVWGYRGDMDEEIVTAFSRSGAMHVLSVSGMHVAMIYSILLLLLKRPDRGSLFIRSLKWLLYSLAILTYVLVSGCSSAAMRSGIMIILFITGKAFNLNTSVWNVMGVSAIGQMWIEPLIVHQLGFILSFLAMIGMLMYTESFSKTVISKQKWVQWIWTIASVSLAAQVFILPVLLQTFHSFPIAFIASSILAVPGGYLVIVGCLINLVLSIFNISIGWEWYDQLVSIFLRSMELLAEWSPEMYFPMTSLTSTLFFLAILFFTFGWYYQWWKIRKVSMGFTLVFASLMISHRVQAWNNLEVIIYSTYRDVLIDHFNSGEVQSLRSTTLSEISEKFYTYGYRSHKDICRLERKSLDPTTSSIAVKYKEHTYLLIGQEHEFENDVGVHFICLFGNYQSESLLKYLNCYPDTVIVLHSSLSERKREKIKTELADHPHVHDIKVQGPFKMKL